MVRDGSLLYPHSSLRESGEAGADSSLQGGDTEFDLKFSDWAGVVHALNPIWKAEAGRSQ